jgi:hypothetical protein
MYGFIYNDLKVKPIPFKDGVIGRMYDLSHKAGINNYVRSPYGVE